MMWGGGSHKEGWPGGVHGDLGLYVGCAPGNSRGNQESDETVKDASTICAAHKFHRQPWSQGTESYAVNGGR